MSASAGLTLDFIRLLDAWQADSPELETRCRLLLLDGLSVAVAGAIEPGPTKMAELARADAAAPVARVIGKGFATSVVQAARINGMAMHVLDYEPMWLPPNHALSPLLPALLALAELREQQGAGPQGRAVLHAIAKGVEAQGRLRVASGQYEALTLTLHPPGAVGPLAAAVGCGVLLGLSPEQIAMAVGIAGSRSSALMANVGSMTKALHCGDGAAHGLEAAQLAALGFTANDDVLGNPRGWGAALFAERFDPTGLTAPIGVGRALDPGPSWKLFPSQFATHFMITAALEARTAAGGADIARVRLRTPPMAYIDRPRPVNGLDGKFSWQYTAAIALLDGRVDPASFKDSRRFAADTEAMLDRIVVENDPSISGRFDRMFVEVTLELSDGRVITQRCDAPLGSWTRPVPDEHVRAKDRALLAETLGPAASMVEATIMEAQDFSIATLMVQL